MRNLREALINFIYPPHCPACGSYTEHRGAWCPLCLEQTLHIYRLPLSPEMLRVLPGAWALGRYHGALRELIRRLKYQGKRSTLPYLEEFLSAALPQLPAELRQTELVIPVPLFAAKEKQRGFNQAELIFQSLCQQQGLPLRRMLVRRRATRPQYGLGAAERRENMKDAFQLAVNPSVQNEVQGRHILLVDDILTTGATLCACAEVLHQAGAASVRALVLASDRG